MRPAVTQGFDTQTRYYPQTEKREKEMPMQKNIEISTVREERLQSIAFWKQYMDDLIAGRPVENVHPDNDPYYLVPENIAGIIKGEEDILEGRCREINNIEDIWKDLDIE